MISENRLNGGRKSRGLNGVRCALTAKIEWLLIWTELPLKDGVRVEEDTWLITSWCTTITNADLNTRRDGDNGVSKNNKDNSKRDGLDPEENESAS
jgi:hypothetical protein